MKDEIGISHLVQGATHRDEVGEDLVGLVEVVAEDVGVYLGKLGSGFPAVEVAEDSPLRLPAHSAHLLAVCR